MERWNDALSCVAMLSVKQRHNINSTYSSETRALLLDVFGFVLIFVIAFSGFEDGDDE